MAHVRLAERRIWVGDVSRELLAGEVHFWRLDRTVWEGVLEAVARLGLDIISTYVAWNFHELAPGRFDFTGKTDPRRDLVGFLELAQRRDFWVFIRPGPYIYAEWPNSGIPDRCVPWHRLHPGFKAEAETWIAAFSDAIQPYLVTHGGPVVMCQADNEADPWFDVYREAFPPAPDRVEASTNAAQLARYRAFCRERHAYATEILRWTTDAYRRHGIDIPITANTYADTAIQDWRAIGQHCDLVGPDLYPTARLSHSPDEHRRVSEAVRYARCVAPLAFIPEFEAGIWHGWHADVGAPPAAHYRLLALTALQAGASGWNWYMLVNRDNWYMSPLNELGRPRLDLAPSFASIVSEFRALQPSRLEKLTDTAVTFDALERAAEPDSPQREVLLRALSAADIDCEFFDVDSGVFDKPLLLYASGHWLNRAAQQRLREFVDLRGGTLVFFQTLPLADETLAPLNAMRLAEPSGTTTARAPQRVALWLGDEQVTLSSAAVFVYRDPPGEPIVAERVAPVPPTQEGGALHVQLPVGERLSCGYVESRGAGRLIVLGVEPTPELLVAVHRQLGVRIPARFGSPGLTSALFKRGDDVLAICTNVTDFDGHSTLSLDVAGYPREISLRVPAHSGMIAHLDAR